MRDAKERGGREAYHAQLREVLGGNMRAVEAMEDDEDEPRGRRKSRAVDQETINVLMEDVIREIARDGELVTREKVGRDDTLLPFICFVPQNLFERVQLTHCTVFCLCPSTPASR